MADFSQLAGAPPQGPGGVNYATSLVPQFQSNLGRATELLKLNPQEQALYQRHLDNLLGKGGVDHPNGSRSTLYQSSVDVGGKTYNIPTVYDGKILPIGDAVKRAEAQGWDKFPSYATPDEAEARYGAMHSFMEGDTQKYLADREAP